MTQWHWWCKSLCESQLGKQRRG